MHTTGTTGGDFPRRPQTTVAEAIDALVASGKVGEGDLARFRWWKHWLGALALEALEDHLDQIDEAFAALTREDALTYTGKAKDGQPIFRSRGKRSGATINRYRSALMSVIKFARRKRLVPRGWQSPIATIEPERESPGRLRYLSSDEYRRLLAAARVSRWPMLHVLIRLAVESGVRRGSLEALRWCEVDLDAGRAIVERTKNGTPHVIVLLPDTAAELRHFGPAKDPTHLVFRSKRDPHRPHSFVTAYKRALAAAGIKGANFHTLRHSHASLLARQGASLIQIAESMNHRTLAMVRRYAHLAVDDRARLLERVFEAP